MSSREASGDAPHVGAAQRRDPSARTLPLPVDAATRAELHGPPSLAFSTYLGTDRQETCTGVARDGAGNLYLVGSTDAREPFSGAGATIGPLGFLNVFVVKLDPARGEILYSVLVGGSRAQSGFGVAVDEAGTATVIGSTNSPDFPLLAAFQAEYGGDPQDGFVLRLNAAGALDSSSYLGGGAFDLPFGVASAPGGRSVVTGATTSPDFPLVRPAQASLAGPQDAFLVDLGVASGGLAPTFSTYVGGAGAENAYAVTLDGPAALLAGVTESADFPGLAASDTYRGGGDAVVARVDTATGRIESRLLGGTGFDAAESVDIGADGLVVIAGTTDSRDFPVAGGLRSAYSGGRSDGFVAALRPAGELVSSTLLGGSGEESTCRAGVGPLGSVFVSGTTASHDFPARGRLGDTGSGGRTDVFLVTLNIYADRLLSSTRIGGGSGDEARAIVVDGSRVAVAGWTQSARFPTASPIQPGLAGRGSSEPQDAFVFEVDFTPPFEISVAEEPVVASGEETEFVVAIARESGFSGPVQVAVHADPDAGLRVRPARVKTRSDRASFRLSLASSPPPAATRAIVVAWDKYGRNQAILVPFTLGRTSRGLADGRGSPEARTGATGIGDVLAGSSVTAGC